MRLKTYKLYADFNATGDKTALENKEDAESEEREGIKALEGVNRGTHGV